MIIWRKSSRSGSHDESSCVEVAGLPGCTGAAVGVRDSKDPDGPRLYLASEAWAGLVSGIKNKP